MFIELYSSVFSSTLDLVRKASRLIFGSSGVSVDGIDSSRFGSEEFFQPNIAVGTAISGRPPHRSVRAELLHTAPTFDVDVRSVLQDADGGYVGWGAIDCRSL